MATELTTTAGLHYMKGHSVDAITVYIGLIYGQSVNAGTITSLSTLAGLQEETGTGYARQAVTLGADTNGVAVVPTASFNPGTATDWHSTVSAAFMATASSGGTGLFYWDLLTAGVSSTFDMSAANANLVTPAVNFFYENVGGI